MIRRVLTEERGTAVLLTIGFMVFLLAMVGFAVDIAYQMTAIGELERSMEAAALAGAGKLGFDDTVFPTARQFAQHVESAQLASGIERVKRAGLQPEDPQAAQGGRRGAGHHASALFVP